MAGKLATAELRRFYGGITCVIRGTPGTVHHLTGHRSPSRFENLIPLSLDLHHKIIPTRSPKASVQLLPNLGELDPENLLIVAAQHYRHGAILRAHGCVRLAHSIRRYFKKKRPDDELYLAAEALHYLRRGFVKHPRLGYRIAQYMLEEEILPELRARPLLSLQTKIRLLEEFGSWLNEQGGAIQAIPFLEKANVLRDFIRGVYRETEADASMRRQWAFSRILSGASRSEVVYALQEAQESYDSTQNTYGIANAWITFHLRQANHVQALDIAYKYLDALKWKQGGLYELPEGRGIAYPTFLGFIVYSILAAVHTKNPKQQKTIIDLMNQYEEVERQHGQQGKLVIHRESVTQALEAGSNIHGLETFVTQRLVPIIPETVTGLFSEAARLVASES